MTLLLALMYDVDGSAAGSVSDMIAGDTMCYGDPYKLIILSLHGSLMHVINPHDSFNC